MNMFAYVGRQWRVAAQAEEFAGINELARATRRCAQCACRPDCGRRARFSFCANGALLLRARVLAGGRS